MAPSAGTPDCPPPSPSPSRHDQRCGCAAMFLRSCASSVADVDKAGFFAAAAVELDMPVAVSWRCSTLPPLPSAIAVVGAAPAALGSWGARSARVRAESSLSGRAPCAGTGASAEAASSLVSACAVGCGARATASVAGCGARAIAFCSLAAGAPLLTGPLARRSAGGVCAAAGAASARTAGAGDGAAASFDRLGPWTRSMGATPLGTVAPAVSVARVVSGLSGVP